MDIFSQLSQAILPGQRVIRVDGWEGLKRYPMPRDSEGIFLDTDLKKDYVYMKRVDVNGAEIMARYSLTEAPVEEFDPGKYVTKKDLDKMMEEIVDGVYSKLAGCMDEPATAPSRPEHFGLPAGNSHSSTSTKPTDESSGRGK